MRRRTVLAATVPALAGVAGCLGDDGNGEPTPDGYAPASEDTPEPMDVETASFERIDVEGEAVPLAPVDVTHNWYARREARFVDARGEGQYDRARVRGAVWSPAPDGRTNDPVDSWSTDDRIVCYCGCPHHLSSLRASSLIAAGYDDVYVIDEGFGEWTAREYPVAGSEVDASTDVAVVRGRSDAAYAGEPVYAVHEPTDQREAAFVGDDGGYELELRFADVTADSEIRLEAPDYALRAPLSELTAGVVTRP